MTSAYVVRIEAAGAWTCRVVLGARSADDARRVVADALSVPAEGARVEETDAARVASMVLPEEWVLDVSGAAGVARSA